MISPMELPQCSKPNDMKKLIILLVAITFATVAGVSQTRISNRTTTVAGTAADTLTASVTKAYVLDFAPMTGKDAGASVQIFTDLVSGTATFGYKLHWSNDGVNFPATAADSVASAKSGASDYTAMIYIDSLPARYLKVSLIATSAAQKSKVTITAFGFVK